MKKFIRCTCFILAMVISLSVPVYADDSATWSSSFFYNYGVYLTEVDSYNFTVNFRVTAKDTMDQLGAKSVAIQISEDGENWATTKTYTPDDYSGFLKENATIHAYTFNYNGSKNFYYRAKIKLYAKNSTGSATSTVYTSTLHLGA